ncbi:MAG: stage II sporulation protein R [Lachnospiraceae bacterium]|nr:stage II sporulation protein R [Lachnospiraceae bacterium]
MKKYVVGTLAAAFCCVLLSGIIQARSLQRGISDKILRFHVLANSDSSADQALKLKVRDEVGAYLSAQLNAAESLQESETIVLENLTEIEQAASELIQEEGYDYAVAASLETCLFPEKTYGIYTFPAGNYEALRVVIGDGAGQNWWCVLYPNLCFAGSMYAVDETSGEELSAELTNEEYAAILGNGDYEVSFKILKFMNRLVE